MGQYFMPVTVTPEGKLTKWSLQSEKFRKEKNIEEYNPLKLTEHSWIGNRFCDYLSEFLFRNPQRVAWLGDYSNNLEDTRSDVRNARKNGFEYYYALTYESEDEEKDFPYSDSRTYFDYKDMYLVNHTEKCGFTFNKLVTHKLNGITWSIYPLSLLTSIGNGLGGGDYFGPADLDLVGTWAFDMISLETELPPGYRKIKAPKFKL